MDSKENIDSSALTSPPPRVTRFNGAPITTDTSKPKPDPANEEESPSIDMKYINLVPNSPTDVSQSPCSRRLWGKSLQKQSFLPGRGLAPVKSKAAPKYSLSRQVIPRKLPVDWRDKIILGSSSASRKSVLKQLGWEFRQIFPDIDEKAIRSENPLELPLLIAVAKAGAIVKKLQEEGSTKEALIITADQIVLFQDTIREKPENATMAAAYLSSYSNHHVSTISAVVCTDYPSLRQAKNAEVATIHWSTISPSVVSKVVAKGEIYQCAGGFRIEDEDLNPLIKTIDGSVDSVLGLPVEMTIQLMNEVVRPPTDVAEK